MTQEQFKNIAHTIPHEPGIYKYYNENDQLLYVGKAKDLRKRIGSYFSKSLDNFKTIQLVKKIHHLLFTIVDSEQDAFLLENALIKEYKPRYNINLKDDKTYPFIVIKKESFPRVFFTRKKLNDGSEYIGPFTNQDTVRDLLTFIKEYIPLRNCKLPLTEANINKGKFKVCLEYHLGNCKGPCEGLQSFQDYSDGIQQMRDMLKGNVGSVINNYKLQMQDFAAKMEFEKAEMYRKKIEQLENYQSKSVVVSKHLSNLDVFSILRDGDVAYVNYLMVQAGTIIQTHTAQLEAHLDESDEEVLAFAIINMRDRFNSQSNELIVPVPITFPDERITITIPKAGDKKKLLELSLKNVNYFQEELRKKKILHLEGKSDWEKKNVLYELQEYLQLPEAPVHIECFDNSNFQGSFPVSAMVCFKDGMPSNKDYRHYNVKTVEGINDFATMKEVVGRRYKRLVAEEQSLPQLVIIDGGKGQLGSAMEAISELGLVGQMVVVGLAKNEEEIFFPGDSESKKLPWDSDSLKLIRRIRDEVHRFGITFHRNKRSKGTFKNGLEEIKGIGKQTAEDLLKAFKSVKNVKLKSEKELAEKVGLAKAKLIINHFAAKTL